MPTGRIVRWNDDKGYGFIEPDEGGGDVFLHINALRSRGSRPEGNELVNYALSSDARGRHRAVNVVYAGSRKARKPAGRNPLPFLLALAFFAALAALVVANAISVVLVGLYLALSFVTFAIYAIDKSAAKRGRWRTSEGTLLLFGLAGGWPGGLLAQHRLRHKSRKAAFLVPFWLTVAMNMAGLWWLTTPQGSGLLNRVLDQVLAFL